MSGKVITLFKNVLHVITVLLLGVQSKKVRFGIDTHPGNQWSENAQIDYAFQSLLLLFDYELSITEHSKMIPLSFFAPKTEIDNWFEPEFISFHVYIYVCLLSDTELHALLVKTSTIGGHAVN